MISRSYRGELLVIAVAVFSPICHGSVTTDSLIMLVDGITRQGLNQSWSSATVNISSSGSRLRRQAAGLRICFQETEGTSQCQGSRSTCSGYSSNPSWTAPFRDETDNRAGGCTYQWQIQGTTAPGIVYVATLLHIAEPIRSVYIETHLASCSRLH